MPNLPILRTYHFFYFHTILFILSIGLFFLINISLAGGIITIPLVLFSLLVCFVLTISGQLYLRAFHLATIMAWLPASFIVGFVLISVPMLLVTVLLSIPAFSAFWICSPPDYSSGDFFI